MTELPEIVELSPENAVEALLEPIETHPELNTFEELASALYAGKSARCGNYTVEGGVLVESGGDVYAIADHGGVILSYNTVTTSLADALLFQAGANGFEMARVHRPDQADYRLSDIKGKSNAGRVAAKVLQIPIDIDAFEALLEERERINKQIAEMEEAVLTTPRLKAIAEMIAETAKKREAEKYAAANKLWDEGSEDIVYNNVRGADGNYQRLRMHPQDPYSVQGSGGYNLSLGRFRKGFNLIAPYVWGQGTIPEGGKSMTELDGNRFTLYPTYVNVGCQTIALAEIERFAKTLNYPLDGSKAE
jgi:hypothetical protein